MSKKLQTDPPSFRKMGEPIDVHDTELRSIGSPIFLSTENVDWFSLKSDDIATAKRLRPPPATTATTAILVEQDAPVIKTQRPRPPTVTRKKSANGVFDVRMLAERWGCSPNHIYSLIDDEHLREFKIGKHSKRITVQEVERFEKGDLFRTKKSSAPVSDADRDDLYIPRTEV